MSDSFAVATRMDFNSITWPVAAGGMHQWWSHHKCVIFKKDDRCRTHGIPGRSFFHIFY